MMKKDLADKLQRDLTAYDAAKKAQQQREEQQKSEEEQFRERFGRIASEVILPAFCEVGERLKENGHDYRASYREHSVDSMGRPSDARVNFELYLDRQRPESYTNYGPQFAYVCDSSARNIRAWGSNMRPGGGGSSGTRGQPCQLDDITADKVHEDLIGLLGEVFVKKY